MQLVPRMRIGFYIMPATENWRDSPDMMLRHIRRECEKLLGNDTSIPEEGLSVGTGWEDWTLADYQRQLKCGDPGFLIIRDLSFVDDDRFHGNDWDDKFNKARMFLLQGLHCSLFTGDQFGPQYVYTFLKHEEDHHIMTGFVSPDAEPPPTIVLKGVPSEWLADPQSTRKLHQLFRTLANLRNFDTTQNSILIQYEDYEECCKALKQLCSRSLKKDGDTGMVDYELTLEDSVSNESQQMPIDNSCNESATTEVHKFRLEEIEKKLNALANSVSVSNKFPQMPIDNSYNESAKTEALKQVEMIEKQLEIVKDSVNPLKKKKAVMKEFDADLERKL